MGELTIDAPYGLVHMPDVQEMMIRDATAAARLMSVFFVLQDNPRPTGYQEADKYGPGIATISCDETSPKYTIVYRVDEERRKIFVIAVYEKVWS